MRLQAYIFPTDSYSQPLMARMGIHYIVLCTAGSGMTPVRSLCCQYAMLCDQTKNASHVTQSRMQRQISGVQMFYIIADTSFLAVLLLIAKGWAIVRRKLSAVGRYAHAGRDEPGSLTTPCTACNQRSARTCTHRTLVARIKLGILLSSYVFLQLFLLGWKGTLSSHIPEPALVPRCTVVLQCKPSLTPAPLKVINISTRRV